MSLQVQFQISVEEAKDTDFLRARISQELNLKDDSFQFKWRKRSIDARKKQLRVNATFDVFLTEEELVKPVYYVSQNVSDKKAIAIIGAGPAGLYAALRAIERGLKPIIFERGKDVRARRRDLAKLNKESIVNPESNYCFGEGGAGTYSDGKLYTRSKKRGNVLKAMEWFVHFGAPEDILVDAYPHIGTNKLPQLIVNMREAIIEAGGEVHFDAKMTDLFIENEQVTGLEISGSQKHDFDHIILATGHSARDIFDLLHGKGLELKAKGFALGVRVEHSQELIDKIQ